MDTFEENRRIVNERNKLIEERKKLNKEKRRLYAQQRLESNIIKKIKTTMIGALASFENGFGHLWGIDLDEEELTPDHRLVSDRWEEVRGEILNKGNMQIRAAQDEISEYNTEWSGTKINFITQGNQNEY